MELAPFRVCSAFDASEQCTELPPTSSGAGGDHPITVQEAPFHPHDPRQSGSSNLSSSLVFNAPRSEAPTLSCKEISPGPVFLLPHLFSEFRMKGKGLGRK